MKYLVGPPKWPWKVIGAISLHSLISAEQRCGGRVIGSVRIKAVAWLTAEKHIRQCIAFPGLMDKVYI